LPTAHSIGLNNAIDIGVENHKKCLIHHHTGESGKYSTAFSKPKLLHCAHNLSTPKYTIPHDSNCPPFRFRSGQARQRFTGPPITGAHIRATASALHQLSRHHPMLFALSGGRTRCFLHRKHAVSSMAWPDKDHRYASNNRPRKNSDAPDTDIRRAAA